MKDSITTFGEAANELGTSYAVIAGLVEAHGLTPKPVPRSPAGKGLDRKDMAVIRKALCLKKGERVRERTAPAV